MNIKEFIKKDSNEQWEAIQKIQEEINNLLHTIQEAKNDLHLINKLEINEMDKYKHRLTQKTAFGDIHHYFHEDREEQLVKLIQYCNDNEIRYELNDKAKEFHNKLYNLILKGE
ncbi:MAG: hypothetical protein [Microvirus sp.]|nr:MAG: hypothetical protein [Microvirus sp.]